MSRLPTLAVVLASLAVAGCGRANAPRVGEVGDAAERVYVAPGKYDEFYAFLSGGFDGQVSVSTGLPSGRLLKVMCRSSRRIPRTAGDTREADASRCSTTSISGPSPGTIAHHPRLLPMTAGVARRPVAVHQRQQHAAHRPARPDPVRDRGDPRDPELRPATTASPFITANSEYVVVGHAVQRSGSRSATISIDEYKSAFGGVLSFVRVDSATGQDGDRLPDLAFPPIDYDLGPRRQGPLARLGVLHQSYNSEEGNTKLEVNASQNDKDYIAADRTAKRAREPASSRGQGAPSCRRRYSSQPAWVPGVALPGPSRGRGGASMFDRQAACAGLAYFLPTPKSPHGVDVDPTGEFIVAGGKLAGA